MHGRNDVSQIKNDITRFVGSKVILESGKGKQKVSVTEGTIQNVYPSIFTVRLNSKNDLNRMLSYSYADVLTKAIEITLCD